MRRLARQFVLMTVTLVGLLTRADPARAYPVGPALSLDKLAQKADINFKGVAVSSGPVQDKWFKRCTGYIAWETQFKVVSVIKGEGPGERLRFRHYDADPSYSDGLMFMPQYYHFEIGRAYLVFAKKGEPAGVFRQLWRNHNLKTDQGVFLCADEGPAAYKTVKDVLWHELTAMLGSARRRRRLRHRPA